MPVMYTQVGFNPSVSQGANANPPLPGGPQGEALVAELHGKWYSAVRAGNVFNLSTAAAGTVIPVQATNLVSTFTLWNPNTSTKNVELISYSLAFVAATIVVSDISLYYQSGLTSPGGTLTTRAIKNCLLGAGLTSVCTGYTANTLVNTVGTNMFPVATLASATATTAAEVSNVTYLFDGNIILPPGSLVTTTGFAAQTSAAVQSLTWAEWAL